MATTESAPKARMYRTLKIKIENARHRPTLLSLPQELRDLIYWYTLVEPRKWDKRHAIACAHQDLNGNGELPPYKIVQSDNHRLSVGLDLKDSGSQACQVLCLKRKGLGLLRANKQVYEEAEPLLWQHNTFCFDSFEDFVDISKHWSESVVRKVERVSFVYPPSTQTATTRIYRRFFDPHFNSLRAQKDAIVRSLCKMEQLVDLELCSDMLEMLRCSNMCFPKLRVLRCIATTTLYYMSNNKRVSVDVGLTEEVDITTLRSQRRYSQCEVREGCYLCWSILRNISRDLIALNDATTATRHLWYEVIERMLEKRAPIQTAQNPYLLRLTLLDGTRHIVKVWGLPNPPDMRARRRRMAEREKAVIVSRAYSCPSPVMLIDDEEDEIPIPIGRGARHWRCHMERQIQSHESAAQQRKTTARVEAQHEAARQKSAQKKGAKARRNAESEVQDERRAARKRSGK